MAPTRRPSPYARKPPHRPEAIERTRQRLVSNSKRTGGVGWHRVVDTTPQDGDLIIEWTPRVLQGNPAHYNLTCYDSALGYQSIDGERFPTHWRLVTSPPGEETA
jgi:hypothetical protein